MWFCIVPARGGSKRILRKNLLQLGKLPLVAVTLKNLISSGIFSEVYVSTEDYEIAKVASQYGALVPFMRSNQLADDYTSTLDVLKDILEKLENIGDDDYVACVYPASVFIDSNIFETVRKEYKNSLDNGDFVISVKKFAHPVERAFSIGDNRGIKPLNSEAALSRTQDLKTLYHDAGQFYIAKRRTWLNVNSIFEKSVAFNLSGFKFLDIDTPEDFENLKTLYAFYHPESYE